MEVFETLLKHYKSYFLAELGEATVGYVCGRVVRKNLREIVSLTLVSSFRKRGVGRRLML